MEEVDTIPNEILIPEDTVRWIKPGNVSSLTFLGKDVLALCDRLHIYFFNILDKSELIYNATRPNNGNGVECFSGHKTSQIFVFAEMCESPRLLLLTYPDFQIMRIIKDEDVTTYAALALTELEQIITLSAYPNYSITAWCWRTNRKLVSCETGIRSPNFFFSCSLQNSLIVHGWAKKFCVWEVAPFYKSCMFLPRNVHGNIPNIIDMTWSPEGNLFCIDKSANVYSILSDGIGMIVTKEYSSESGPYTPFMSYYKNGLIIYGTELQLRHLTKVNKEWIEDWNYSPESPIVKIATGGLGEILIALLKSGQIIQISYEHDCVITSELYFWQSCIQFVGIVKPFGNTVVTVNNVNLVCLWNGVTGQLFSRTKLRNVINYISCSPVSPLIAMCIRSCTDNGICIMHAETQLRVTCQKSLTDEELNHIVWSGSGNELIVSATQSGQIFFLKYKSPPNIEVVNMINIKSNIVDSWSVTLGKDIYFMCLALVVNVYTNVPEKALMIYNFLTSKKFSTVARIEPTLIKVFHLENNRLLGINSLPREIQVFSINIEEEFVKINLEDLIPLDFEISGISIEKDRAGVLMWGLDGMVVYKSSIFKPEMKFKVKAKHYLCESLKNVVFDPQQRYAVSLTFDGSLTVHNISSNINIKVGDLSGRSIIPEELIMNDIFENCEETWIQNIENRKENQETAQWEDLRNSLENAFESLQKRLLVLLEENILAPPLHQLPLSIFNLHLDAQAQRDKNAAHEREKVHAELEEQIKAQDKITEWIKVRCWDTMDVIRKELHAIFTSDFVENYALLPKTYVHKNVAAAVENFRKIESMQDQNLFKPWIPPVSSIFVEESLRSIHTEKEQSNTSEIQLEISETKTVEQFIHQITGSSAHLFITPVPHSYIQMLTQSNLQMRWQTTMTEENTHNIQVWFNRQFDEMMANKEKELSMIEGKNMRLNVIISELNTLSELKGSDDRINVFIRNPEWAQEEIPAKLIAVEQTEVGVTPYVSPSQVVIPQPDLGPKDDFREKALMYMMDGVLEKLWHEEIKKAIPKPQCMLVKDPEDFNEDDLKQILEWEKNVEFRNQEREKYWKMLRSEYAKLSTSLNEMIDKFNQKVKEFYLMKLKVESAIGQENLKLMRLRTNHLDRIESVEKIQDLERQIVNNEIDLEKIQKEIQDIQFQQSDCHAAYESLMARDRALDKGLRSNFADVSPIVADLCYKLFKKRPKLQLRASMTPGVLYEMAYACLTKERPEFLHVDCNEFLRALDQLDMISNMPPVMDENIWQNMCKLRRIKIDNEIKMKAACGEIAEVEATLALWVKRSMNLKTLGQRMRHELSRLRSNIASVARNVSIQLVMKSGFVETATTGHIEDFDSAVLIKQDDVDAINVKILEAGQQKLKAMRQTTSFKKHILSMEWEHAKSKMEIRHLEQDLYNLERIKVTKEIRKFLQEKTKKNVVLTQSNAIVERQIENTRVAFDNQLYKYMHRVEELEMKIGSINTNIEKTDEYMSHLKIKVSEKHHSEDPAATKKKVKVQTKRMEAMVLRSKLLSEVQKQHIAIVLLQTELELQRLRTFPTLSMAKK